MHNINDITHIMRTLMIKHCEISKLFAVLLREEHPQKEFFQSRTDPFMHLGHFVQIA